MPSPSHATRKAAPHRERGYILLTLLLAICLMTIFVAAILPSITFNIRRDREEEMIHRGVQYSRAIRAYYKKFGRYPTKLEDLENTSNMRFLRKRYKDPITGQDFKLLHFGDVKLTFSAGIGGAGINGATPPNGATPFGTPPDAQNPGSGFANSGNSPGGSSFGGSSFGGSSFGGGQSSFGQNSNPASGGGSTPGAGTGTDPTTNSDAAPTTPNGSPQAPGEHPGVTGQDQLGGTTFGGGPIVGVVSASKKDTIREFNHKKKYNEWQFIYDPATDRGGLLMTPNQPPLQGVGQANPNLNGQPSGGLNNGAPNSPGGLGNSPYGPVQGIPNNPNPPTTVGPGTTPNLPPDQ
jgi:type II secretory pathway pseudopilin PulG